MDPVWALQRKSKMLASAPNASLFSFIHILSLNHNILIPEHGKAIHSVQRKPISVNWSANRLQEAVVDVASGKVYSFSENSQHSSPSKAATTAC